MYDTTLPHTSRITEGWCLLLGNFDCACRVEIKAFNQVVITAANISLQ